MRDHTTTSSKAGNESSHHFAPPQQEKETAAVTRQGQTTQAGAPIGFDFGKMPMFPPSRQNPNLPQDLQAYMESSFGQDFSGMYNFSGLPQKNERSGTHWNQNSGNSNSRFSKSFFPKNEESGSYSIEFFASSNIQAKLIIGEPKDKYEKEADMKAEEAVQNMNQSSVASTVQTKCNDCAQDKKLKNIEEDSKTLHLKNDTQINNRLVQTRSNEVFPKLESELHDSKGSGQSLDKVTQHKMEQFFGVDFSKVRVHNDDSAFKMNQGLGARAFTKGRDIYFNKSEYNTSSTKGMRLLAHELTHTIQQGASNRNILQKQDAAKQSSYLLKRNAGSAVKLGTNVTYTLEATEKGKILDEYNYNWRVIDSAGRTFYSTNTDEPSITLVAAVPGDYLIQAQILNNGEWIDQTYLQQNVYFEEKNTELGGLSVGNFDFNYDGTRALIEVRVKFSFENGIKKDDKDGFKGKFFKAIRDKWSNSGVSFVSTGVCAVDKIPLEIVLIENESNYHKLVDVEKDNRRPNVINDMNMYLSISENTIAHEFGHVLGLYDEYDGGFWENNMFWHDDGSHQSDSSALMVNGSELRRRYFTNFLSKVNNLSSSNCKYKLEAPFKK